MLETKDYIIEVSKLVNGNNEFEIETDKALFDKFECNEAQNLRVNIRININKSERLLELKFEYKGWIDVLCGRCLGDLRLDIDKTSNLYIKFGERKEEMDINQWILPEGENEINILSYVYEDLRIMIPIAPMHSKESDCDKEMIDKLSQINEESSKYKDNYIDPRWEKLKELKK